MRYVIPLSTNEASLETVGGKGMSLSKMLVSGLPVPDGFHITTGAYRCFVSENSLEKPIRNILANVNAAEPAALESASQSIYRLFENGVIPSGVKEAIVKAYADLHGACVAVRSSATAEDLPDASFAGQQETYLNLHGEMEVLDGVKKCWASLWTARAIAYRIKNKIDSSSIALAVVVQKLIAADAAGVMFTVNPVNGRRDEILINAAWGLGEALVSGLVTPDTVAVRKASEAIICREIAEKRLMTVRTEQGTKETPVSDAIKRKPVLTKKAIHELIRLGTSIEQLYKIPMDVEWVVEKGNIFIVQARPITTLPPDWTPPEKKVLYARGSLAEHIPAPVTPFFGTWGLEIINQTARKLFELTFRGNAPALTPENGVYQVVHGYIYSCVRIKVFRLILNSLSPRLIRLVMCNSIPRFEKARKEFTAVVEEWENKQPAAFSPHELMEGIRTVFTAACKYFTDIQTTLPAASSSEILFTKFYNGFVRKKQDPQASAFLMGFDTSGLAADKLLFDICEWVRTQPLLMEYLLKTPSKKLSEDYLQTVCPDISDRSVWNSWQERITRYFTLYGRTAYDFDLVSPTPCEAPETVFEAIGAFLAKKAESPWERQKKATEKRKQAEAGVLSRIHGLRKTLFVKLLHWAQSTGPMREDSIFAMGMGHPVIHKMMEELGRRLVQKGVLAKPSDIYWLEKSEVEECVERLSRGQSIPFPGEKIEQRKNQRQDLLKLTAPISLPEKNNVSRLLRGKGERKINGKTVLTGAGTSAGVVTAPACVLFGPEDFTRFRPGDVLVAVTTTPAWTPLFSQACAVVTDIGGPLSHSSIVAREYGIPAVMATRTATRAIHNGQIVTVDGGQGTVSF
jgi:pyruvate,water dikinase